MFRCLILLLLVVVITGIVASEPKLKIGLGISDITGPAAQINMMGYAKVGQDTRGIHTRLYARAFIVVDEEGNRIVYVNVELCAPTQLIRIKVIQELDEIFGKGLYTHENFMLAATHTHSGPGGYFQYLLYTLTQEGFIQASLDASVSGVVRAIVQAHKNLQPGFISYAEGMLLDASVNRSPASYMLNPEEERAQYKYDIDKIMQVLKFTDAKGNPIGMANWFPVHCTSMNNTNKLISSDHKGYASMRFEQDYNGYVNVGKGPFVAMFSQANEGDVSPNTKGGRCINTGLPCDFVHSTCPDSGDRCIAFGPGKDMFESTKIIGKRQYEKAKELFAKASETVTGSVRYVYQNMNMSERVVTLKNGTQVKTCTGSLGVSFAAGTADGEGSSFFKQGTTEGNESKLWNFVRNVIKAPSPESIECQKPKAIFLPVGEFKYPYDWTPELMPTQMFEIGNIVIVALPGEFTTMAGRRLRSDIQKVYDSVGRKVHILLAGLANTYSNYITTYEEYQLQRYEGGATLFGPHTLDAYREHYTNLTENLVKRNEVPTGPELPNLYKWLITFKAGVLFDAPLGNGFGDVLTDAAESYSPGARVKVRFSGANPRNNMRLDGTFLLVERMSEESNSTWITVATDANWHTMFIWRRYNAILGTSDVTIIWDIPIQTQPGTFRIRYFGDAKSITQTISEFDGSTRPFQVV